MVALAATSTSDVDLLGRLQRGEDDAWAELTRNYGPRLFSYLRHNLPSAADAEDALSETMLAAVRALPAFDGKVALSTFLYSLAYRKMADFWRRRTDTLELHETVATGNGISERAEFEEVLDRLPEASRQVIMLRYHVGLSVSEIAEIIDRSYKGTESLLSRARVQLRTALEEAGAEVSVGDE